MIHRPSIHLATGRTAVALALATLVVATSAPGASAASPAVGTSTASFASTPIPVRSITPTNRALPVNQGETSVRGLTSGTSSLGLIGAATVATPVDLYPTLTQSSYNHYWHTSNDSWCVASLQTVGLGPDLDTASLGRNGKIAVGFSHYYDAGNDPFPCDAQSDTYYRGGVGFDMSALSKYVAANGLKSVYLEFRLEGGNGSCIDHIGVNSDAWENLGGTSGDLPDGGPQLHPQTIPLSGGGLAGELDVTALIALSIAFGGGSVNPHLHFVFVGTDENVYAQDNNTCDSVISNLFLVVAPKG